MQKDPKISAGLAFMLAAAAAMPKTLGDRERIAAFSEALRLAIRNRFAFAKQDADELRRLGIETCVGVFRPLDYYLEACVHGGTYAKMWEAHRKQKPWIALTAIAPEHISHNFELLANNRVTLHMGVLLPQSFDAHDEGTLSVEGQQVWWVTTQDNEFITVCRYRLPEGPLARTGRARPFQKVGRPFRIRRLNRQQWAELNAAPVEEKQAA